ncbi:hypothetical protein LINGRAHAP2_LOCUS15415 [Linum grandiflorum]
MKNTATTTTTTASSNNFISNQWLPDDLIIDIQRRLTVSGLRRLCCVSKSWNSILSNPNFVYESLFDGQNEQEDPNAQIIVTIHAAFDDDRKASKFVYTCLPYDCLLNNNDVTFREFPHKTPLWVVGCEGGLICLRYGCDFGLFNPATCETKMLPPLPGDSINNDRFYFIISAIGFVMMEKDGGGGEEDDQYYRYKVVSISRYEYSRARGCCRVYVFSSDDESLGWRESLSFDNSSVSSSNDVLLSPYSMLGEEIPQYRRTGKKKKCYWISHDELNVNSLNLVSFDMNTEVLHVGKTLPFNHLGDYCDFPSAYMVKEETLVVLFNSSKEVWVLQQLGVEESWCKLFTIPLLPDKIEHAGLWSHGQVVYAEISNKYLQVRDVTTTSTETCTFQLAYNNLYWTHRVQMIIYTPSEKSLSSRQVINHETS